MDVVSDEMSQIFTVLSPLPLTPPALRHLWSRLRSLPAGLRSGLRSLPPPAAYLMELRSTRNPRLESRNPGVNLPRYAERQLPAMLHQLPPRFTRSEPDVAPVGSVAEPLG